MFNKYKEIFMYIPKERKNIFKVKEKHKYTIIVINYKEK